MESHTPSGPKPPNPQQPPSKPDTAWISPRLREKLNEPDAEGPKQGSSPLVGIILALLVIGGGGGLFLAMRSGAAKEKAAADEKVRVAAAAAAAESIAAVARADSLRLAADTSGGVTHGTTARPPAGVATSRPSPAAAARTTTTPAGAARPSSTKPSTSTAAGGATAPAVPKAVEKGPFGLDVSTFLLEDRANSEQARLSAALGLPGRVVTRNEDGGDVYHVVLGSFATRAAAEKKAEGLVAKDQVNQARTVSLAH